MDVVYFKKAQSQITRVVAGDRVEVEVSGYRQRFFVNLSDPASVGPAPLTTLSAREGSTGDLYLSPAYLLDHGLACDLDPIKYPEAMGGSFAGFWRYLNSPARTPAIAEALAGVRAFLEARGREASSPEEQAAIVRSVRAERSLNDRLGAAFPQPGSERGRHLDRVATSLVLGLACGAI